MTESTSRRQFRDILSRPDAAVDLAEASLLIACEEYPGLDVPAYLARLDAMGSALRERLADEPRPERAVMALNRYLFQEEGFHGNAEEYYDPRNSYLNEVLDRRTGIPISLSTVYMEVARRAGLRVEGVGMPGHFIVRVVAGPRAILIDP
ncbi:MAG TPA: transglutaminase-like domain-containing protein, partial [Vicinamibacteria bacterium]|nr:transglutaminase-like domain-containing protein [Vicinamibacteria bacterium]